MFFSALGIKYSGTYYIQALIIEFLAILLPGLLYLIYKKMDIRRVIRFKALQWSQFFIIAGLSLSGYTIIIFCNFIWIWILTTLGGKVITPIIPAMKTSLDVLMGILVIGGSAALAEEFLFRGIILRGYERFGSKTAILLSGILFGILHMKTQSVLATVVLGILIGYLVYKPGSILTGMIYHFFIGLLILLHDLAKRDQVQDEIVTEEKAHFLWWQFIPLVIGLTIVVGMYAQDLVKIFG